MQVDSLGRFRIEKELGRGAMGRVLLAFDPTIERRVAIKTIQIFASLPEAERDQARERFLREARSAGKVLHPGIVTIFDVAEADGVPYIAMEYVEGETLDAVCSEDALLPVPDVIELIAVTAEALGFAHERGIVHRDIKPANLMRVSDRAVKIMDFGLAKSAASSMTHDGAIFGTPNYMSPEQVRGEPLDGRTDLFSLGVVCFEMLTGVKPFGGDSMSSVLYRIVHEPPRETPPGHPRVPCPLAKFLERALAKQPDARFRDGAEFAAELRWAGAAALAPPAPPPRPPRASAPTSAPAAAPEPLPQSPAQRKAPAARARRSPVAGVVAVTLGLAGIGAVYLMRIGPFAPPPVAMLIARVRTEPAGLLVRQNGTPLAGDVIQFPAAGPFEILTSSQGCREAKHRVEAADAGREIVLVLDPESAEVVVDPGVPGARVALNGQDAGAAPATVALDLCRDNVIGIRAEGYRETSTTIPARATPLDARSAALALKLEVIPTGRLLLPPTRVPTSFLVDGEPVPPNSDGVELPAGPHQVRATNEERFVDVAVSVDVPVGGNATPAFDIPPLARLVVQTFPPNCRVTLKRAGSTWRPLGETPLRYELAAGRYVLRVESPVSGESREQDVNLVPGANAPIRISFGRSSR